VLKVGLAGQTPADLAGQLALLKYLNAQGYPHAPLLRPLPGGRLCAELDLGAAYVCSYVSGGIPEHAAVNDARLGEAVAALQAVRGFTRDVRWTPEEIVGHIINDRVPHLPPPLRGGVTRLAGSLRDLNQLPRCPVHGDISLDNTLLTPGGQLVILDWDGAGRGVRLLDTAKPLFEFVTSDLDFDEERAAAFYQAYFRRIRLTPQELNRCVDMGLLLPLNNILYGDSEQKWRRIQWLDDHREQLTRWLANLRAPGP
jgi:Ser/Thr protein kinase RdoA (MazF antagonist)